jgi:hypothetical protein
MNTRPITQEDKDQELKTIRETLKNDDYYQQIIHPKQKHELLTVTHKRHKNQNESYSHIMVPIQDNRQIIEGH